MKAHLTLPRILLLVILCANGTAFASDFPDETKATGQPFVHPAGDTSYSKDMRDDELLAKAKPTDNGKVQYISGGIAVSGMRAIDTEEHLYNLKVLFVEGSKGEYIADTKVNITDSKGNSVLDAVAQGPVMLVKLPAGRYKLSTKASDGSILAKRVDVADDHLASYVLRYPPLNQ
jgi:hypothetical protein